MREQMDNPLDGRCAAPDALTPWRATFCERSSLWHVHGRHATIPIDSDLATIWGSGAPDGGAAQATIMAAAPEMLAALKAMVAAAKDLRAARDDADFEALGAALAQATLGLAEPAIAKAEGR